VPNLKDWTITGEEGGKTLRIELSEDARDRAGIEVLAERSVESPARTVPMISAESSRETVVRAALSGAPWLSLRVDPDGFRRVEYDVPPAPGLALAGVYESHLPGDVLGYRVEERPQEIKWELHYLFQVESRKIEELVIVNMDVKQRPLFGLSIGIPEGYRCASVEGPPVKDWWASPGNGEGSRVEVEFSEAVLGPSSLIVVLVRTFPRAPEVLAVEPVVLSPRGDLVRTQMEGSVLIASHVSVNPRPVEENGLRSTSLCEGDDAAAECKVGGGFRVARPLEPKLAYWFEQPDFAASFSLERVPPRESVTWITLAEAHETWVSYSTHLHWRLLQGSSRTFEFEAPASLGEIVVTGDRVREVSWEDRDDVRWYTVHLDSEVFDTETFTLGYESSIEGSAAVPALTFPRADRSAGYLLTANASPYELRTRRSGTLQVAQESDVPFLPEETGVLEYYKVYGGEWNLELDLIRTVAAETLAAVIDWVELETLIRRDGSRLNAASIRMQNKTLQFLPVILPDGSRLLSVSVAGKASSANTTTRNGRKVLLVPLLKTEPGDLSYEVKLTWERGNGGDLGLRERFTFDEPVILDVPVTQTFWTFYVPEEYNLHRVGGNMEETTLTARKIVKLSAREEERQRLKAIVTGSYGLDQKARALSNYQSLQTEILQEQRDLDLLQIRQEAEMNRRLGGDVDEILTEARRLNEWVAINNDADMSGDFQVHVEGLRQEIERGQTELRERGLERVIDEREEQREWISNGDSDFFLPEEAGGRAPVQVLVVDNDGDGLVDEDRFTQVGANVYIERKSIEGDKAGKAPQQRRGEVTQYFNVAQSATELQAINEKVDASNLAIRKELGLGKKGAVESYSGRMITGRFKSKSETQFAPGGGPQGAPPSQSGVLRGGLQPVAPGEPVFHDPRTMMVEGAYSIPVLFPRTGRTITFKKLKSDAEVKFTALDERVSQKTRRVIVIVLLALLLAFVIRVVGNREFVRRFAERTGL
jgi:hypothetical protein